MTQPADFPKQRIVNAPTSIFDPHKYVEQYTVDGHQLLGSEINSPKFIVDGCIPCGSIIVVTGAPAAGKSYICYELARACLDPNGYWLHGNVKCSQTSVLLLNYDNPTDTLKLRLKKLGYEGSWPFRAHSAGLHAKNLKPGEAEMLRLPGEEKKLKYIIDAYRPGLIIFDSLRQGMTLDENDSKAMSYLMSIFKSWVVPNGGNGNAASVILIHHTSKSDKTDWSAKARGSGEIIASADVVLEVAENTIKWTKHRAWDPGFIKETAFSIEDMYLNRDGLPIEESKDAVTQPAPKKSIPPKPSQELAKTPEPKTAIRPILKAIEENFEDDDEVINLRTKVVAKSELPGERETKYVEAIRKLFSDQVRVLSFADIQKSMSGTNLKVIKECVTIARNRGVITAVRMKEGRGYRLTTPPDSEL